MPFTEEELKAMTEPDIAQDIEQQPEQAFEKEENVGVEIVEQSEEQSEEEQDIAEQQEPEPSEPIFDKPDYDKEDDEFDLPKKKQRKKRKPLTEEQKEKLRASLAKAREKSKLKRAAMKTLRLKNEAAEKAKAKKHIKERKKKKMLEEAHLEVNAEQSIIQEEQDLWNEDRITSLMNRTLDTYFQKRKQEKTKREQFPMGPQGQAYYMPAQPAYQQVQAQRAIPKPAPTPPRKPKNPYFEMFGLTADDEIR